MKRVGCLDCSQANLSRRHFLRAGSLSLLGISLDRFLEAKSLMASEAVPSNVSQTKAEACILLWLEGGPSQLDSWDPKGNSSFKPISTNVPGIQISELLPKVARHMDKLSIIRSMRSEEIDHPEATHYAVTGHRPNAAMQFPSIGAVVSKELGARNGMPAFVIEPHWEIHKMYQNYFNAAFLGPEYNPMGIPDPSRKDFTVPDLSLPKDITVNRIEHRASFQKTIDRLFRQKREIAEFVNLDSFRQQAFNMILSPRVRKAFDFAQESEKTKDTYGRHSFGQSVLMARRLVEYGCRFVTAAGYDYNAWDACHSKNDMYNRDQLAPALDQALAALMEDLDQRGLLESTIVLVMGEFGRTPHVNPQLGRDHWPHCWSLVIGGGGIRGGRVVGASDERGAYVAERMVTIGDLYATIYKAMGIDWEKTYMTPIGRPIKIANSIEDKTGKPVHELI
jgi:hypothetical protein